MYATINKNKHRRHNYTTILNPAISGICLHGSSRPLDSFNGESKRIYRCHFTPF